MPLELNTDICSSKTEVLLVIPRNTASRRKY